MSYQLLLFQREKLMSLLAPIFASVMGMVNLPQVGQTDMSDCGMLAKTLILLKINYLTVVKLAL